MIFIMILYYNYTWRQAQHSASAIFSATFVGADRGRVAAEVAEHQASKFQWPSWARRHHRGEAEVDDRHVAVGVEEEEQVLGLGVDGRAGGRAVLSATIASTRRRVASGPGPGLGECAACM